MKKLILATLVAASAFASSASYAACTKTGYIERVTTQSTGTAVVYIRPSSLFNAYFVATTADVKIVSAANAAVIARTWVSMTGNAAACPGNNGNMGAIVNLVIAP